MKVISINNLNGGVGKTHTATNLAQGLARKGKKILLVDADPQASTTDNVLEFGNEFTENEISLFREKISKGMTEFKALEEVISGESAIYDLSDVLEEPEIVKQAIYHTKRENLDIIPSSMRLDEADKNISDDRTRSSITRMYEAFQYIENCYDFIVIDGAPRLDLITTNSLLVSDLVIIPIKMDRKSIKGLLRTLKSMVLIQKRNHIDFDFKFLLQMVNRNRNDKKMIEFYKEYFKDSIFNQTIRFQAKPISDADLHNQYVIDNKKSNIAQDYLKFIDEVYEYFRKEENKL